MSCKPAIWKRKECHVVYNPVCCSAANIAFEVNYFFLNFLYLLSLKQERSKYCSSFKYRIKLKKAVIHVLVTEDEGKLPVKLLEVNIDYRELHSDKIWWK
jgi:hypothetical protein